MLHEPRLLLLDEPTSGVDPRARRDFWDEIHRLSKAGLTVLVSTHYMDEAERCDRIVYIHGGCVVARGTVAEVIAQSGLQTFLVEGEGARRVVGEIEAKPGVEHAAFFGSVAHVSGRDRQALEAALAPYKDSSDLHVREEKPSLEDVFIHLQGEGARDR
jgi:ABC-2 type transport system ATP-binding protein